MLCKVVIRHNMVTEIWQSDETADDHLIATDPLSISTLLATNNQRNGCLDGVYDLPDFATARYFATLCLDYQKNLCERSLEAVNEAGAMGQTVWTNRYVPTPKE